MSLSRLHTFGLSVFPTFIAVGNDPASSGIIRIPWAGIIKSRNQAGSGDISMFSVGAANRIAVGATLSFGSVSLYTDAFDILQVSVAKVHTSDLFDAAGLTDDAVIWQQPAGSVLLGIQMVLDAQFVAASMTDLDVVMGLVGDEDGLLAPGAHNLVSDAVGTMYSTRGAYWNTSAKGSFWFAASATDWKAYATAVGANLSTTSAGQVTFKFAYAIP